MVSGHPKSTEILQIDGLSTGRPDLGLHKNIVFFYLSMFLVKVFFVK